jgi:hypothetical protein
MACLPAGKRCLKTEKKNKILCYSVLVPFSRPQLHMLNKTGPPAYICTTFVWVLCYSWSEKQSTLFFVLAVHAMCVHAKLQALQLAWSFWIYLFIHFQPLQCFGLQSLWQHIAVVKDSTMRRESRISTNQTVTVSTCDRFMLLVVPTPLFRCAAPVQYSRRRE